MWRTVASKQAQRQKTRENIENVTETKGKISTLVIIELEMQMWKPNARTTKLIAWIKVSEQNIKF